MGTDAMVAPEREQQGLAEALVRAWDRNNGAALALSPSPSAREVLDRLHFPESRVVSCLVKPLTRRAVRLPHWPTPVNTVVSALVYPSCRCWPGRGRCAPSASRFAGSTRPSPRSGSVWASASIWPCGATRRI